ncbi:hypothetical protein SHVI106290_00210 [Shewanella violacea]|uniref:Uncharacterized protein n=1 Tax=Shewanella violacea (strain JCM 10179 / CIP 106290 / LMG 19151 / DSS12) TaxID=637905 RepID=D4ZFT6_SHEVD|nr:hypothetical protein SVI_0564 [Shewanella violacea DSS12]
MTEYMIIVALMAITANEGGLDKYNATAGSSIKQ